MIAKPLPTLLELMISDTNGGSVSFECKNGWCTQCACPKKDLNQRFGPIQYRTQPVIPPPGDKILPCISTQSKLAMDMAFIRSHMDNPNIIIHKTESTLARLPAAHEIGSEIKTLGLINDRVMVTKREDITEHSIILRRLKPIALNRYVELLTTKEHFFAAYGEQPGQEFKKFTSSKPFNGYELTDEIIKQWIRDGDGKCYFQNNKSTYEVDVGSIISANGFAVTQDMLKGLRFERTAGAEHSLPYQPDIIAATIK